MLQLKADRKIWSVNYSKNKVIRAHAHKRRTINMYRGRGGKFPSILFLGISWR